MRWLFLLLLTLNIFYYVWANQRPPVVAQSSSAYALSSGGQSSIRLISEDVPRSVLEVPGSTANDDMCLFLGGFERHEDALALEQRLLSLDLLTRMHEREVEVGVDYWVYLPPLSSRDAALRQLKELQSRAIDSYLVSQGELANGISLGFFSRHDSARSVLERMRSIGYAAELKDLKRTTRVYWSELAQQSVSVTGSEIMLKLTADFPGLQQLNAACENSVATAP